MCHTVCSLRGSSAAAGRGHCHRAEHHHQQVVCGLQHVHMVRCLGVAPPCRDCMPGDAALLLYCWPDHRRELVLRGELDKILRGHSVLHACIGLRRPAHLSRSHGRHHCSSSLPCRCGSTTGCCGLRTGCGATNSAGNIQPYQSCFLKFQLNLTSASTNSTPGVFYTPTDVQSWLPGSEGGAFTSGEWSLRCLET